MSNQESFDDFTSSDFTQENQERPPFQFREKQNDMEETLEWLKGNFEASQKMAASRLKSYVRWSFLFKGIHWRSIGKSSYRDEYGSQGESKKPKMVDNMIWEMIEHKVSQMAKLGADITCIPWNNEQSDINNAKSCEMLLKARFLEMDFETLQDEADRLKFKYGTVFQIPSWNKDIGPIHESYENLNKMYKGDIPKHILKQLKSQEAFRIGDADMINACPWEITPELFIKEWKHVNHFDWSTWKNIHELKAMYPKKASEIKENERSYLDFEENMISVPSDMVNVRHFFHKKTKWLPGGAHIVYTDDVILEFNALPYNHGELPLIVDRDIIIEKELFGRPKISNIEQRQKQTNNIESAIARDLGAGSAPKWLWPKGAVDFKKASNEFSVMEYKGAREPKLVANNPVSAHAVAQLDRNEQRMAKLMKVYDISRGNVPPGIEANTALRFLDEQEDQANTEDKNKRKKRIVSGAKQLAAMMGQYYDASDNRTARILGKNDYMIKNLKDADFMKVYDVQMQNTSALPDSKSGKIATIIDMNMATQTDPVFRRPEVVKMMDLGMDDAFVDMATASTNAAQTTFEEILQGSEVPEPQAWDDLLIYYSVFFRQIQDYGFKTRTDEPLKQKIYTYIKTLEGLLWTKSKLNPKVQMELSALDYFPSFFKPDIPNPTIANPIVDGNKRPVDEMPEKPQENTEK